MNPTNRTHIFILLLVLLIVLLPVLTAVLGLMMPGNLPDNDDNVFGLGDFRMDWVRLSFPQLAPELMLGMSIFVLFVVYLGGRSNDRRFNDRTLDGDSLSSDFSLFLKTVPYGAVFNFLFSDRHCDHLNSGWISNYANLQPSFEEVLIHDTFNH